LGILYKECSEHPTFIKNEEYPGKDFILGICDDAIQMFTMSYCKGLNKGLFSLSIEIFRNLREYRFKQLSEDGFANLAYEVLK
jgi:hypothetical protein